MSKLLTYNELAEHLRVRVDTLYVWVSLKRIPYQKVNGATRFDAQEIQVWLKAQAHPADPKPMA